MRHPTPLDYYRLLYTAQLAGNTRRGRRLLREARRLKPATRRLLAGYVAMPFFYNVSTGDKPRQK